MPRRENDVDNDRIIILYGGIYVGVGGGGGGGGGEARKRAIDLELG